MADDAIINAATPSPQVRQKGHLPSPAGRATPVHLSAACQRASDTRRQALMA